MYGIQRSFDLFAGTDLHVHIDRLSADGQTLTTPTASSATSAAFPGLPAGTIGAVVSYSDPLSGMQIVDVFVDNQVCSYSFTNEASPNTFPFAVSADKFCSRLEDSSYALTLTAKRSLPPDCYALRLLVLCSTVAIIVLYNCALQIKHELMASPHSCYQTQYMPISFSDTSQNNLLPDS